MKILFIVPPLYTEETYGKFAKVGSTMPFLGMCYLAGVLRKNNFKVKILDTIVLRLSLVDVVKKIKKLQPHWGMLYRHLKIIRSLEDINKILQTALTLFLTSNTFQKLKNIYK